MGHYTDPRMLAEAQKRKFAKVQRSMRAVHEAMARDMLQTAQELSAGPIKQATLDAMGNPFGRGGGRKTHGKRSHRLRFTGRGAAPLLPINVQTGRLQRAWRLMPRNGAFLLLNTSPEGKFVLAPGGTSKMVARGFWTAMKRAYDGRKGPMIRKMRTAQIYDLKGQ